MLFADGLVASYSLQRLLARAARSAVETWAQGDVLEFNIRDALERSDTVSTIRVSTGYDPVALQAYCKEKCGVVLGTGIGDLSGKAFRIAHMGHVNAPMILGTLGVVEMALHALRIPHGEGGVTAAIQSLADAVRA
jgi:alanine-glyoxylate transaminase/serine-glyoxylate transaminase/serine-pyruvate transaminase